MFVVIDNENVKFIVIKFVGEYVEWYLIFVEDVIIVVKFYDYFVVKMQKGKVKIFIYFGFE